MRLSIDHRTVYRFTEPQARIVQLLRVTPQNTHDQTIVDWHIAVDRDARLTEHRDGFGNAATMLYVEGPVERIEIAVSGEVVTTHSDGVLHGTWEPLPPRIFLRDTPATRAGTRIEAFAATIGRSSDTIAMLHRLNTAVRERFAPDDGRPEPGLTVEDVLERDDATARDLAQVFITAARSLGVPARYVTGYCNMPDAHRPTSHAWADAWVPELGWIGFDPMLELCPETHHVRVAVGLDAAGAAPIAGSRLGEGEEQLDVDVTVNVEE